MRPRRTHFQKDSTDQLHHDVSVDSLGICGTNLGELALCFYQRFEERPLATQKRCRHSWRRDMDTHLDVQRQCTCVISRRLWKIRGLVPGGSAGAPQISGQVQSRFPGEVDTCPQCSQQIFAWSFSVVWWPLACGFAIGSPRQKVFLRDKHETACTICHLLRATGMVCYPEILK